jgi:heme exporter protein D
MDVTSEMALSSVPSLSDFMSCGGNTFFIWDTIYAIDNKYVVISLLIMHKERSQKLFN